MTKALGMTEPMGPSGKLLVGQHYTVRPMFWDPEKPNTPVVHVVLCHAVCVEKVLAKGLVDMLCYAGGGGLRYRWRGRPGV